jgi:hypothetical protein
MYIYVYTHTQMHTYTYVYLQVVLPDMGIETPPVLRGRALHCVSSFAQWISTDVAVRCFNAAASSIGEDSPLPVRKVLKCRKK